MFVRMGGARGSLWLDDFSLVEVEGGREDAKVAVSPALLPRASFWKEAEEALGMLGMRLERFHRRSSFSPQPQQVTLVSHLAVRGLPALTQQLSSWSSFASVCLVVAKEEEKAVIDKWWRSSASALQLVDLHLLLPSASSHPHSECPANILRNIAIGAARSTVVLLLDVDVLPFTDRMVAIDRAAQRLLSDGSDERQVFVLPAFEFAAQAATMKPRDDLKPLMMTSTMLRLC